MGRRIKDYAVLALKGMAMGAADVVPGVSGGTIAFIAGIYDELVDSIRSVNVRTLRMLSKGRVADFWKAVNGNFLSVLLLGIAVSVFSLAKLVTSLLEEEPVMVWSFFFGLVLASTWSVSKDIEEWNVKTVTAFLAGAVAAYFITAATPAETSNHLLFVFLCGAIAICAMILPGISGSFILVLLGKYSYIMEAVHTLDWVVLGVFGFGAALGITSFSRALSYALKNFRNAALSVLSGFMLGSLNKVWPWKGVETLVSGGQEVRMEHNVAPDADVAEAVVLMAVGFMLVFVLEKISAKRDKGLKGDA